MFCFNYTVLKCECSPSNLQSSSIEPIPENLRVAKGCDTFEQSHNALLEITSPEYCPPSDAFEIFEELLPKVLAYFEVQDLTSIRSVS